MPPSVPESVGEMLYSSPLLSVKIGFLKFTGGGRMCMTL